MIMPVVRPCLNRPPEVRLLAIGRHTRTGQSVWRSDLWWLHAYTYHARLHLLGQCHEIRPGTVSLIPPGIDIRYEFPELAIHTCAHLRLPVGEGAATVPILRHQDGDSAQYLEDFTAAVGFAPVAPDRAQARIWDLLWRLVDPPDPAQEDLVTRAQAWIERELAEGLSVAVLARRLGCSHNTLTRAFRRRLATTVVGYIRKRRLAQARYLLEQAGIPPQQVAAMVGCPDLQAFNKLLRRGCGRSPRQLAHRQGE